MNVQCILFKDNFENDEVDYSSFGIRIRRLRLIAAVHHDLQLHTHDVKTSKYGRTRYVGEY